jgi:hypothetical protein
MIVYNQRDSLNRLNTIVCRLKRIGITSSRRIDMTGTKRVLDDIIARRWYHEQHEFVDVTSMKQCHPPSESFSTASAMPSNRQPRRFCPWHGMGTWSGYRSRKEASARTAARKELSSMNEFSQKPVRCGSAKQHAVLPGLQGVLGITWSAISIRERIRSELTHESS